MSERSFSRRRRGGMHFRPSGGLKRPDRAALEARAVATGEKAVGESVYDLGRHQKEIERSENIAAGLPPEGTPVDTATSDAPVDKKAFREPNFETPAEVKEESYRPVAIKEVAPQGLVETIKAAATKVLKKVQHKLFYGVFRHHAHQHLRCLEHQLVKEDSR